MQEIDDILMRVTQTEMPWRAKLEMMGFRRLSYVLVYFFTLLSITGGIASVICALVIVFVISDRLISEQTRLMFYISVPPLWLALFLLLVRWTYNVETKQIRDFFYEGTPIWITASNNEIVPRPGLFFPQTKFESHVGLLCHVNGSDSDKVTLSVPKEKLKYIKPGDRFLLFSNKSKRLRVCCAADEQCILNCSGWGALLPQALETPNSKTYMPRLYADYFVEPIKT